MGSSGADPAAGSSARQWLHVNPPISINPRDGSRVAAKANRKMVSVGRTD